ncbi:WD40 repeat domain-containing protein [Actinomadura gamaensis]|uniref:WD40 repeat domain-containing protein n=1 Tax=Actinomadura gamaensis TaxID=1763541 RepID=A0ABV9U5T2_9ACTN
MSTDLYGVRVLDVRPDEARVRFRVFVVYYDTGSRTHAPLSDDPSLFFQFLWEAARHADGGTAPNALRDVTTEQRLDRNWVETYAHRYVRRVVRVAARNDPVSDWSGLMDFYYDRGGRWADEERLVQGDFDVEVTDARLLDPLVPGLAWGSAAYPLEADQVLEADAPTVLDLRTPAVVLEPFDGAYDAGTPSDLAFSDDGEYLAVTSQECELVVFRTADWSEQARVSDSPLWGQDIQWVPGRHVITKRVIEGGGDLDDEAAVEAYDLRTGATVPIDPQPREYRSRTGRYRADGSSGGTVHLLTRDAGPRRVHVPGWASGISFTGDETRMFVGGGTEIHAVDPESGTLLRTLTGVEGASGLAVRPDGAYLTTFSGADGVGERDRLDLWRVSDGALLMRCRSGGYYVAGRSWSPDGTMFAAAVITGNDGYDGEVRIYRPGPPMDA